MHNYAKIPHSGGMETNLPIDRPRHQHQHHNYGNCDYRVPYSRLDWTLVGNNTLLIRTM